MAIQWNPQYENDEVSSLAKIYAGFSFKDNGKRIVLPTKYNSEPLAKAKAVLDATEALTCYRIGSMSSVIELNNDTTRPDDPGAEPRGETFKFKAREQGEVIEHDLSYHVPGFLAADADAVQDFGEFIASTLSEPSVLHVRFVGTAGQSRR